MKVPSCLEIHWPSVAVAFTSVGGQLLGSTASFYYIKVFVTKFYITPGWLNLVQILFGIWNAINDPLVGYCQDFGVFGIKWIKDRKKVILYGCFPLCLGYMSLWIPWYPLPANCLNQTNFHDNFTANTTLDDKHCLPEAPNWLIGLHLLVALFVYDTFVSLVLSAQCGLFTEMTTEHSGRVRIVKYMGIASLVASLVIFPLDYLSESLQNYVNFEISCAVVAVVALGTFIYSGLMSPDPEKHYQAEIAAKTEPPVPFIEAVKSGLASTKQICCNRDWLCVVAANFVHIMRITGNANFLAIFTENLVSPTLLPKGSKSIGFFYAACNTGPQLLIFIISPLMDKFGAWAVLMSSIVLTAVNSVVVVCIGRGSSGLVVAFLLIDCCLGQSLWPAVYNIFFPNIIEEDFAMYKRKTPLSTLVFTLNALITKPAISVAPIVITSVLNIRRYSEFVKSPTSFTDSQVSDLFDLMFWLVCLFPLATGVIEALVLLPYRMKFPPQKPAPNSSTVVKIAPKSDVAATFV